MIGWLLSPIGKLASIAVVVALLFGAWQLDRHRKFNAGRSAERQAAIERANAIIKQMEKDNAQISDMDHRAKCAEFGLGWVHDQGCVD